MKLNWYLKRHYHNYYSMVEPFRKDGQNQHEEIDYCGRLADEDIKRINYGIAIMKGSITEKPNVEDIIFKNQWRFLDITVLNLGWGQWDISKIFNQSEDLTVHTSDIAKIFLAHASMTHVRICISVIFKWCAEVKQMK